jgi:uncharacterized membrane protein
MDGLLLLLGLAVVGIPIGVILLFVMVAGLKARVTALETTAALVDRVAGATPPSDTATLAAMVPEVPELAPIMAAEAVDPVDAAESLPLSGPWAKAAVPDSPERSVQSEPVVIRSDLALKLVVWLRENWVYAISALSLALAGIFLVQYGMERGLLPPGLRVAAGVGFGLALVTVGEWLRRRFGDDMGGNVAYLPATFSSAGVVSVFAAIVAARQFYGLIGPELAFAAQVATAILAVVLGWYNGVFLVAIGLLGAAASPFIVSGGAGAEPWLYGYFALIAAMGLAVDALRRWGWISVLALVLGYAGGWLSLIGGAETLGFAALMLVLAALATIVPERSLIPRQDGPSLLGFLLTRDKMAAWPNFPVRLVLGAIVVSSLGLFGQAAGSGSEAMVIFSALTVLTLGYLIWAERAEGLADIALFPAAVFVGALWLAGLAWWPVVGQFAQHAIALREPETSAPMTVSVLLALAAAISAGFAWRALRGGSLPLAHGLAAALTAPVAAAVLEMTWNPSPVLGPYAWALHVIALAAAMVGLAKGFAAQDGADHRRMAYATLSALSLVAMSLFILTSASALTLSLAVLMLVAAGLDQRFKLPEMGWFIQAAVAVLGYRLLADPGMDWAFAAPLGQVLLAYAGVIAAMLGGIWLLKDLARDLPKGVMESAAAGLAAILANILIARWLLPDALDTENMWDSYWGMALNAMPWLVLMLMQIYRARLGGSLLRLRQAIALLAGTIAFGVLGMAVLLRNPLFAYEGVNLGLVRGPMIADTLLLAYGVPGLVLLAAALKMPGVGPRLSKAFVIGGAALVAFYVGLEIRRFFQGDYLGAHHVTQGELYTYTLALMLLGAALLYQAIAKRSDGLRKIAMGVIALVVAKVFLLDAAGLTGLTRVVSFLGLGLSLAGLAWLNRWTGHVLKGEG